MRTLLLAGAAMVTLAGAMGGVVHAADIYEPAPQYGAAPPVYQPPPPPVYAPPPRYGYAPPVYGPQPHPGYAPPPPQQQAYGPPPAVAYEDDEEVVAPPRVYRDAPVYMERPVYQHCWWEWGHRVCAPRRGW